MGRSSLAIEPTTKQVWRAKAGEQAQENCVGGLLRRRSCLGGNAVVDRTFACTARRP